MTCFVLMTHARGLDNSGKSSCVRAFLNESLDGLAPTLGFEIRSAQVGEHRLHLWDVGGQKSIRPFWRNYFEDTDGLVWVVDSGDVDRLQLCREQLSRVIEEERLVGASIVILANKQDLEGALTAEEISVILGLDQLLKRRFKVIPCSAVSGEGVKEGFEWIVGEIASRLFVLD